MQDHFIIRSFFKGLASLSIAILGASSGINYWMKTWKRKNRSLHIGEKRNSIGKIQKNLFKENKSKPSILKEKRPWL